MSIEITVDSVQPFEHTAIEVTGLTTVTGVNNGGKSSLCRAIKGAVANGTGTSLVRYGCDAATVTITAGDQTLQWSKSHKGKSSYRMNGEEPIFPGRELPDEVKDFGIRPMYLTGETLWPQISSQFNELYLIDKPGSLLGEAISDVNKVSKLNGALKLSEAAWRQAAADVSQCQKELDTVNRKIGSLADVPRMISERDALSEEHATICKAEAFAEDLRSKREQYILLKARLKALDSVKSLNLPDVDFAKQAEGLGKLRLLSKKRKARLHDVDTLRGVSSFKEDSDVPDTSRLASLVSLRDRRKILQKSIVQLPEQLDTSTIDVAYVQRLVGLSTKKAQASAELSGYSLLKTTTKLSVQKLDSSISKLQSDIHSLEHQLTQDKGICTQCNRPL